MQVVETRLVGIFFDARLCVGHLEHVLKTADVFEAPFIPLNACELQNSPFCFCYETSSCVL